MILGFMINITLAKGLKTFEFVKSLRVKFYLSPYNNCFIL